MSDDQNLRPSSKLQSNRPAQVVPHRGSKELSNQPDRRSSYNIEQYDLIKADEMKNDEFAPHSPFVDILDRMVILLVIIYTLLVFINFSFTSSDAEENADIKATLYIAQVIELVILCCFCVEILLRIYLNGAKTYFSDCWQIFDALVIVASIVLIILDWQLQEATFQTVSKVLRGVFRFLRLFLVFRKYNQVKTIRNAGQRYKVRSPVEKVIEILRDLADTFEDPEITRQLTHIVTHISNNTLYEPIFEKGTKMNEVMKQWNTVREIQQEPLESATNLQTQVVFMDEAAVPKDLQKDFDANILDLSYNYFDLFEKHNSKILVHLLNYYFQKHQLFSQLKLNPEQFSKVAEAVANGYHNENPYHNVTHAFDVTHTMYFFIERCNFKEVGKLSPLDYSIMLLAAATHDIDHPGFNNLYISHSRHPLAHIYNDKSPLEQHHSATFFKIVREHDMLRHFSLQDYKYFRERVVGMVLSTDNAVHGKDFAKLKARLVSSDFDPKAKDKAICMEALMHGADISNPFKPIQNYVKWTERILQEFWNQGDKEKELGLPVSMLCDRKTTNTAKAQLGFIDFMVLPYYQSLAQILPIMNEFMDQFTENKKYWAEKVDYYQELLNKMN